jgi:hypothetical protein
MRRRDLLVGLPATGAAAALGWNLSRTPARAAATFEITYTGDSPVPPQVRDVVQFAADRWASVLNSPVPIKVQFQWLNAGSGPTSAATAFVIQNFPGAPKTNVFYPNALANKIAGSRVSTSTFDAVILVNAQVSPTGIPDVFSWYLGTDGKPSPVQFDLMNHVLFQLAWGLGLGTTYSVLGTQGRLGVAPSGNPLISDTLLADSTGKLLTSFPANSNELGSAIYAGPRFIGTRARAVAGKDVVFDLSGRLNEAAFPICTNPHLFASFIRFAGQAVPGISALDRAILEDIGWGASTSQRAESRATEAPGPMLSASVERPMDVVHAGCEVRTFETEPLPLPPRRDDAPRAQAGNMAIQVNFQGSFPEQAKPAILKAAENWSKLLTSPVGMIVTAYWDAAFAGILGYADVNEVQNFAGAPLPNVLYPSVLANRFAGSRITSGHDVGVHFFPADANFWYFGTDGKPGVYQYDLVSIAMHEIGHGLGHLGAPIFLSSTGPPRVWDLFFAGTADERILDYPRGSQAMTDAVTKGAHFRGPKALAASKGAHILLHPTGHRLPPTFCSGLPQPMMGTPGHPGRTQDIDAEILGTLMDIGWGGTTAKPVFRTAVAPHLGQG